MPKKTFTIAVLALLAAGFAQVVDLAHFAGVRNDGAAYETMVVGTTLAGPQSELALGATTRRLRLRGASALTLGGLSCGGVACGLGDQGRHVTIDNATDYPATIVNENVATTASDRFVLAGGVSRRLPAHSACDVFYDGDASGDLRWHAGYCGPRADCLADSVVAWNGTDDVCAPLGSVTAIGWGAPWQSGRWYFTTGAGSTTVAVAQNFLRCTKIQIPNPVTINAIWLWNTAPGEAGSKVRAGFYADDGTGRPGPLIVDAGQINGAVAFAAQVLATSAAIAHRGQYWTCIVPQSCPTTCPTMRAWSSTLFAADVGTATPDDQSYTGFTMSGVTGALPNPFVVSSVTTNPAVKFGVQVQ